MGVTGATIMFKCVTEPRYISRWETFETDWDSVISELKVCPSFVNIEREPERVKIELDINGKVLDYPSFGGGVENNSCSVRSYVNKYRKENGVPALPYADVSWGSSRHMCGEHHYKVFLRVWMVKYCEFTDRPYQIAINPEIITPIVKNRSWKCDFGWHDWEEIKDFVRKTDNGFGIFLPSCIQKCIFRCKRCDHRKLYYKTGWLGGGKTDWYKCSKEKEKDIDCYPRL
jgi:hypothetical protein